MPLNNITSVNNVMKNKEMVKDINKESIHMGLMAAGLTPGVGFFADAADSALYLMEGEFGDAALSGLSAIPFIGQYAGSLRMLEAAKKAKKPTVKLFRGITDVRYEKTFLKDSKRMKGSMGLDKKVPEGNIVGGEDLVQTRAGSYEGTRGAYGGDDISKEARDLQRKYFGVTDTTRELPSQALYTSTNPDVARKYATRSWKGAEIPGDMADRMPIIQEFEVPVEWLQKHSKKILSADKNLFDTYNIGGPGSRVIPELGDMTIFDLGLPKGFLTKIHRYGLEKQTLKFTRGTRTVDYYDLKDIGKSGKLTSTWDDLAKETVEGYKKWDEGYRNIMKEILKVKQ